MRSRAEYALALVLQLVGAGVVLLVSTRHWQQLVTPRPRPLSTDVLALTGRDLDAAPTALALVGLAGVVAVIATRGPVRRLIGLLVAVAGVAAVWRSLAAAPAVDESRARALLAAKHPHVGPTAGLVPHVTVTPAWALLSAAAAALMALAGVFVALRGGRWSALGAKYEAPEPTASTAGAAGAAGAAAAADSAAHAAVADAQGAAQSSTGASAAASSGAPAAASTAAPTPAATPPEDDEAAERARLRAQASLWNALDRGEDPTRDV